MRGAARMVAMRIGALLALAGCGLAALVFLAASSDFAFRGCDGMPAAEWQFTANCGDSHGARIAAGGGVVLSGVLAIVLWRRSHA